MKTKALLWTAMVVTVAATIAMATGCPSVSNDGPRDTCAKVGQTCKLDKGLLGVCTEGTSLSCDGGPCLVCMGQH